MALRQRRIPFVAPAASLLTAAALLLTPALTNQAFAGRPDQRPANAAPQQESFRLVQSTQQCPDEPGEATFAFGAAELRDRFADPGSLLGSDSPVLRQFAVPMNAWEAAEHEGESLWVADQEPFFYLISGVPQVTYAGLIGVVPEDDEAQVSALGSRLAVLLFTINPETDEADIDMMLDKVAQAVDTGEPTNWLMNDTCWYVEHEAEPDGSRSIILYAAPPVPESGGGGDGYRRDPV